MLSHLDREGLVDVAGEVEADDAPDQPRYAGKRSLTAGIGRGGSGRGGAPGKRSLTAQMKARDDAARSSLRIAATGAGTPLPAAIASAAAGVIGHDVAGVRVHVDGQADAIGARAFAAGDDLHFGAGAYQPDTASGLALIGHELAHVAQQRSGRVVADAAPAGELAIHHDAGLESEADRLGDALARAIASGTPATAAPATATTAAAATATTPAAIQGAGTPPPAPQTDPSKPPATDVDAKARWKACFNRFKPIYTAALTFVTPPTEATPSRATLLRNACEWIRDGQVALSLVSLAAAPRQTVPNDLQYIGDGPVDPAKAPPEPDPTVTAGDFQNVWGYCDGTTMWLVDLVHPAWKSDDVIRDTLIHEIQHDAGAGPNHKFDRDANWVERYQSEFRSRWMEPEAQTAYGDPKAHAKNVQVDWTDASGQAQQTTVSGFDNERQEGIFKELAKDSDTYDFGVRYFTEPRYQRMVLAYKRPVGGNLVDSVRIEVLAEKIVARAPAAAILTAAIALDATDRHFLAKRKLADDFWKTVHDHLTGALAPVAKQIADVVDRPDTYRVHTVVSGETLSLIAGAMLGDVQRWTRIDGLPGNHAAIGHDPNLIEPGLVLLIPSH